LEVYRACVITGLLESTLYRPQKGHYADLAAMATALFESQIHPSIDENKRVCLRDRRISAPERLQAAAGYA
jgi:hypothetical protein